MHVSSSAIIETLCLLERTGAEGSSDDDRA
jgi:hypothetical protein